MIIDTHTHLDMKEFEPDRDEVIKRALASDVSKIITVGVDLESSKNAVELSQKYPEVYAAVGIQPEEVDKYIDDELKLKTDFRHNLEELARNLKVVAIGECGLDHKYTREKYTSTREQELEYEKQKEIFRRQLGLAVTLDLPVIVHCREAEEDIITEVTRYKDTKKLRGVIHCFTVPPNGGKPFARKVLNAGFYISFSGIITFPNAKDLREVAKEIPLDRILVETDSPFLAPQSHRSKRNEPTFVTEVVKQIAQIKGIDEQEVLGITTQNAKNLFGVN